MFKDINLEKNKSLFVTATNTHLANKGFKVGYFKPFETGVIDLPEDGSSMLELTQILNPDFMSVNINDVVPYQFKLPAAPYIAKKGLKIDNAYPILIVPSNLGSINDNLLSQEALRAREINYSWLINLYKDKDSFEEVTLPFYTQYFEEIEYLDKI